MTDTQLNQAIKQGKIAPHYLLWGEETALMEASRKQLLALVMTDGEACLPFNLHQFDGEKAGLSDIVTAYTAFPMMAPRKCVMVKNWKLEQLVKKEWEELLSLLERPNPTSVLVLYYTAAFDPKKSKPKQLLAAVNKVGVSCEFTKKSSSALQAAIKQRCESEQVSISSEVAGLLLLRCQSQFMLLQNEVTKLIAYVGPGGEITSDIVTKLGCVSVQASAFDLSTAVLQGQADRAFLLLDQLFFLRTEPVMMLGALGAVVSDLHRLKWAAMAGVSLQEVQRDFSYASRYRLEKSQQVAKKATLEGVCRMIEALHEADRLLKSSKLDARTILEVAISKMLAATTARVSRP